MRWFALIDTVFYNVSAGNRNNRFFPAIKVCRSSDLRHFNFRNISRSGISVFIKIFVDDYAGRKTNVSIIITAVTRIEHDFAIEHHESKRLTYTICRISGIPGKAAVHNTDNFAFHVLVNPVSLVKHSSGLILRGIHLGICRNNADILIVNVSLHNMNNLTIVARIVVQNDFGFTDTGSVVPVCFCDEVVIAIRAFRFIDDKIHSVVGAAACPTYRKSDYIIFFFIRKLF